MVVEAKVGQSLMDIAMENAQMEDILSIARENNLPIDYCFDRTQRIDIPDYKDRVLMDMNTGIEGDSSWVWLLSTGGYNQYGRWVDYDWWKDI